MEPTHHGPIPYYFSGTNSRAYHGAHVTPPSKGFTRFEFLIGGTVIDAADYPAPDPGGLYVYEVYPRMMFDSTRFADGSSVEIKLKVWTDDGGYYENAWTATVHNKASLLGRYDMDINPLAWNAGSGVYTQGTDEWIGLSHVADRLTPMNYRISHRITQLGWDKNDMFDSLADCNVLYIHTHGNEAKFWTDKNDYWYSYPNPPLISPENAYPSSTSGDANGFVLLPTRQYAIGEGFPPINSGNVPSINLAFIQTCESGRTNSFAEAFLWPYRNYFTQGYLLPENQAELGYEIPFERDQVEDVTKAFWDFVLRGKSVYEARAMAYEVYSGSNKPGSAPEFLRVWGDFATRLKTVYTGSYVTFGTGAWFRRY